MLLLLLPLLSLSSIIVQNAVSHLAPEKFDELFVVLFGVLACRRVQTLVKKKFVFNSTKILFY